MEQWFPWSTESSYAVVCGAVALCEQIQLLHWSTRRIERLPGSTESSSVGARGAVALWEQIQVFLRAAAFLKHTEQLCGTHAAVELY